jgi:hypothetical protein
MKGGKVGKVTVNKPTIFKRHAPLIMEKKAIFFTIESPLT